MKTMRPAPDGGIAKPKKKMSLQTYVGSDKRLYRYVEGVSDFSALHEVCPYRNEKNVLAIEHDHWFETPAARDAYFEEHPNTLVNRLQVAIKVTDQPFWYITEWDGAQKIWVDKLLFGKGDKGEQGEAGKGIIVVESEEHLAYPGDVGNIYFVIDNNNIYVWDAKKEEYLTVGREVDDNNSEPEWVFYRLV